MTEKRFTLHKGLDTLNIMDNAKFNEYIYINKSSKDMELLVGVLNALHEENEQLKQAYTQLKHRHSLLHDVCIDAECDRDSYRKDIASLEKENEQLKQQIKDLYKFVKYDVDNEIDVYPKSILEHLVNILKIIGDVE